MSIQTLHLVSIHKKKGPTTALVVRLARIGEREAFFLKKQVSIDFGVSDKEFKGSYRTDEVSG